MPAPSPLAIASSSVQRLRKEEASYHKELAEQEAQVKTLEEQIRAGQGNEDGNAEFMLKQQRLAIEQTKGVFAPLQTRIAEAVAKLEEQIAASEGSGAHAEDLERAKTILAEARAS